MKSLILFLCLFCFAACSNDRSNRISKSFLCDEENDIASQTLTETEKKDYVSTTLDFSKNNLKTTRAYVTVEVPDSNGNTVTFSFANSSIGSYPTRLDRSCAGGLEEDSQSTAPLVFQLPLYTEESGEFKYQETTLSFGHPEEEDSSDYISNETKFLPEAESQSTKNTRLAAPTSFSDLVPSSAQVYEKKNKKESDHSFLVLYTDEALGMRVRLSVEEIIKK